MSCNVQKFGSATVARVRSSADLKQLLTDPLLKAETVIIKPNWVGTDRNYGFTESDDLRMLLEVLDGRIVVTEAYNLGRKPPRSRVKFNADGKEVSWDWLFKGKGWRWLEKRPSWDWFREGEHWDRIREYDRWFLDEYGFTDLFNEHGVEYVSITEELWQGRSADPKEVKKVVEERFTPVFDERLYSLLPKKLYELRGATFVSFAKMKRPYEGVVSFTVKNFFGLLPDPLRAYWHQWFDESLIGIIKVYASLFDIYGICEGLRSIPWCIEKKKVLKDLGILAFGRNPALVDAVLCSLIGIDVEEVSWLSYLKPTGPLEDVFGSYERRHLVEAKAARVDWFPP